LANDGGADEQPTMLETKGILAVSGVPFLIEKSLVAKFLGNLC
jgi:hypothetical protein